VADCLKDDGRVFFADDAYRTPDELVDGPSSSTIRRRLDDCEMNRRLVEAVRPKSASAAR